jgi:hypothetical protein
MSVCISCECTDENACVDDQNGNRCSWIELRPGVFEINGGGLCSFCAEELEEYLDHETLIQSTIEGLLDATPGVEAAESLVELVSDAEANSFLRARRAGA